MEQEYTTSIGYKIVYALLCLIFWGIAIAFILNSYESIMRELGLLIIPAFLVIVGFLILINLYRRKLIISDYSILYINIWGSKQLSEQNIIGFRFTNKSIIVEPVDKSHSRLYIRDYFSLSHNKEMVAYLNQNFKNLDKIDLENNKQEILNNSSWNLPYEEKELKLNKNRKFVIRFSLMGIMLFIISIYFHSPNPIFPMILLIYPLLGIFMLVYSKGLISLYAKKNSARTPIFTGLIVGNIALIYQSWAITKIMDYNKVFEPVLITASIIFLILLIIILRNKAEKSFVQFIYGLLFSITYAMGSILMINYNFDYSKPTMVFARIIGSEKSYRELLIIDPSEFKYESISISGSKYQHLPQWTKVSINVNAGLLGIPWIYSNQ